MNSTSLPSPWRLLACLLWCFSAATATAQVYSLGPHSLFGAGGAVNSGLFTVQGSIGQFEASGLTLTGGGYTSLGGFWGPELIETLSTTDEFRLTIGSAVAQSGQTATLPIAINSTEGLSNLVLTLTWPANNLTFPSLIAINPSILSATIQTNGMELTFSFEALPGQTLPGSQEIAALSFSPAPGQASSTFVPIPISSIAAEKPYAVAYTNYTVQPATVTIIAGAPLLTANLEAGDTRVLNLYGWLGTNYQLQSTTNLALPNSWTPVADYTQTNGVLTIPAPQPGAAVFYRIVQQ